MEHLNIFVFYVLGQSLADCRTHINAGAPLSAYLPAVNLARTALNLLLSGNASGRYRLVESAGSARTLVEVLDEIQGLVASSPVPESLPTGVVTRFGTAMSTFDSAIGLELGRAPIFWVKPKSVFDTSVMISMASKVYTDAVADRLPKEALDDTDHAGRCIAFSLATAAGFHIARATEAVMKRYMAVYGCEPPTESQRNWGQYIKALDNQGANKKVVAHLKQIKDLHRNPLSHPEVHLGLGEAVTLFSICTSAIQAMVADMETKSSTPDPAVTAMLPPAV